MTGGDPEEVVVRRVLDALHRQDVQVLSGQLHPYVHWTRTGVTTRGRTKVLAMLDRTGYEAARQRPTQVELREGQVYRWTVADGARS